MSDLYQMLSNAKTYDDIKRLILAVNAKIDYCKTIGEDALLSELKEFLTLLSSVAAYVLGKKYEMVAPDIIKQKRGELTSKKEVYDELIPLIDDLIILDVGNNINLDIPSMNKWLDAVCSLYSKYGYELTLDDFSNIFRVGTVDYKFNNDVLYEYMKLFFEKRKKFEDASFIEFMYDSEFSDKLLAGDNNPILEIISAAVNSLNNSHRSLFAEKLNSINSLAKKLGFGLIDLTDLYVIGHQVSIESSDTDSQLLGIRDGVYSFITDDYFDSIDQIRAVNFDIDIVRLCNMLTDNNYRVMDDSLKNALFSDLYEIMSLIIKWVLLNSVLKEFNMFAMQNDLEHILVSITNLERNYYELNVIKSGLLESKKEIEDRNSGVFYSDKRKGKQLDAINTQILNVQLEIEEAKNLLDEFYLKRSSFISSFYDIFDFSSLFECLHVDGFNDLNKIFGVFDFRNIPVSVDDVNKMDILKKYSITLPNNNSGKLLEMFALCLKLTKNRALLESLSSDKMASGISSYHFDKIYRGKFDDIIDTVDIVKKRN